MKKKKNIKMRRQDALAFDEYKTTSIMSEEAIDREMDKILNIETFTRPVDEEKEKRK